jgi:hypothetical protein
VAPLKILFIANARCQPLATRGTDFSLCPSNLSSSLLSAAGRAFLMAALFASLAGAQTPKKNIPQNGKKEAQPTIPAKSEKNDQNPAQIELLETKYRFEANGDSRKEVHTRVKINSELGVRQFARLNFDFNRSFQSVEIPLVRVTHPSGGVADILPSAITDNPNPAVVDFPAYHDVRVKSVRILGLQPGDILEYRVITTTTHHPLAPDFWLDHTFDRSGVVTEEIFELDLPASRKRQLRVDSAAPATSEEKPSQGDSTRDILLWKHSGRKTSDQPNSLRDSDIRLTTYDSWPSFSSNLSNLIEPPTAPSQLVRAKATELAGTLNSDKEKLSVLYEFVSKSIKTVDLPLGTTAFRSRDPEEILGSGYAIPEDKFALLASLAQSLKVESRIALFGVKDKLSGEIPGPSSLVSSAILTHIFTPPVDLGNGLQSMCDHCGEDFWLDPAMEVAPFAAMPATLRGREAFVVNYMFALQPFARVPDTLPFASSQQVSVNGRINMTGVLDVKAKYTLRGDNELLLRVTFHQTPKEKWKDVAQLLALSDGFRGEIKNVTASDPYATKEPFTVEYEIEQPKFVDWSKKVVRIPALLPSPGLPDVTPSAKETPAGAAKKSIDLGTPLEIDLDETMSLPEGTTALAPTGTSVERDYAIFSAKYSAQGNILHATRKLHFISQEIPVARAGDLNAFLHAVQADQAQLFTLQPPPQK